MLIADMESRHRLADVEMAQQVTRSARVLGQDAIDFLQHTDGPQGNVLKVANRGGHKIKFRHSYYSNLREISSLSFR